MAAELRDEISKLEAESLAASATALAHENAQYAFRLGQKVRHKKFGKWLKHLLLIRQIIINCISSMQCDLTITIMLIGCTLKLFNRASYDSRAIIA